MQPTDGDDPFALLARFEPGAGRTARAVLHPRLTFLPCPPGDHQSLARTFTMAAPVRCYGEADVAALATDEEANAERRAAYDALLDTIQEARAVAVGTANGVDAARRAVDTARAQVDRVAGQRARAEEACTDARARLAVLESAGHSEVDLRRDLEAARAELERAICAWESTATVPDPPLGAGPDLATADAVLARAERAYADVVADQLHAARDGLDVASRQLEMWAAKRTVDMAREDRVRAQRAVDAVAERARASESARARVDSARTRLAAVEHALAERVDAGMPLDAAGEAETIRAQIDSVHRSLDASERAAAAALARAEQQLVDARREAATAVRGLRAAVQRAEPAEDLDADAVLVRLRARRQALERPTADDGTVGLLRRLVAGATDQVALLVEPFPAPPADLVTALVELSATTRAVYVTAHPGVLDAARHCDPGVGAVRIALDTNSPRPALARPNGTRP